MIKQNITDLGDLRQGAASVTAVFHGTGQVYPGVIRTDSGTDYGAWSYSGATRSRSATPWTQDIYQNSTSGPKVPGVPSTQIENATITTYWDGFTYWNAACSDYDSIDYQQVRPQYNWSDGLVTYGDWTNGALRNKGRIENSCGWVRNWSDWARTGATCNFVGTDGSYNCDGDYTVRYYQEARYLQFPDGSGRADTQYQANGEASRQQEDGVCGYIPVPPKTYTVNVEAHYFDDPQPISIDNPNHVTGTGTAQMIFQNGGSMKGYKTYIYVDGYFGDRMQWEVTGDGVGSWTQNTDSGAMITVVWGIGTNVNVRFYSDYVPQS